jgi:hypothetical protein
MIPKKPVLDVIRDVKRFSDKIIRREDGVMTLTVASRAAASD